MGVLHRGHGVANEATIVGMTSHLGNLAVVYEWMSTQVMALR